MDNIRHRCGDSANLGRLQMSRLAELRAYDNVHDEQRACSDMEVRGKLRGRGQLRPHQLGVGSAISSESRPQFSATLDSDIFHVLNL